MKTNEELKRKFLSLNQWKDLEGLVNNYYKAIKEEENTLDLKTISFLLFNKTKDKYTRYTISKNNGTERTIHAPKKKLKLLQQIINECIQACYTPRSAAHGFVRERSIVTNAKNHVKRKYVYNIDLENFFPAINFHRVVGVFKSFPFRFDTTMARHLANLCCHEGVLPQGAPTSPVISNLICRSLDRNLWNLAKTYRVRYSRYADDITFSANQHAFTEQFLAELEGIIQKENFSINRDKVRLQRSHEQQVVTGIVVNEGLSVKKKYKKDLRFLISLVQKEKDNAEFSAQDWLEANYKNRQRYFGKVPNIRDVIWGKLEFMRMVVGDERLKTQNLYKTAEELGLIEDKQKKNKELKTRAHLNKKRQDEWKEKWQKYFEENDQYLISNIDFEGVVDPEKLLDDKFVAGYPVSDDIEHKDRNADHSPQRLVKYLSNFRSTSKSVFGKLIHANNELYEAVVYDAKKELYKLYDAPKKEKLPVEIFRAIQLFINNLWNPKKIESFSGKTMGDIFPEIIDTVYHFNRLFRFGTDEDQQNLNDVILYQIGKKRKHLSKYNYLEVSENIGTQFSVMTSTRNVYAAISSIFSICQNRSNGLGALSVRLSKKTNKSVLRVVDIGSYTDKDPKELKVGGGDFERLKALLWSYCDLNIYTIYGGEDYRVPLLPIGLNVEPIDERIDGFTYELIFYHPMKILLVDDGVDGDEQFRLKRYERLLEENHEYEKMVEAAKNTDKSREELQLYNVVFVHSSYPKFEELRGQLTKGGIPYVAFSGGKSNHFDAENPNTLTLNVNDFYSHLPNLLDQLKENQQVDLGKLYKLIQNRNDSLITVASIEKIIEDNKLVFPELNLLVYDLIRKFTKLDEVPEFKSRKDLVLYLEDFKINNNEKMSANIS